MPGLRECWHKLYSFCDFRGAGQPAVGVLRAESLFRRCEGAKVAPFFCGLPCMPATPASASSAPSDLAWRVVGRKVVEKDAPVIRREAGRVLTLTTCWPIGYLGGAPERLILRAVPLAEQVATRG